MNGTSILRDGGASPGRTQYGNAVKQYKTMSGVDCNSDHMLLYAKKILQLKLDKEIAKVFKVEVTSRFDTLEVENGD